MESFLLFMLHVYLCYAVLFVPCSLVIISWKRADLLTLLCDVFSCVFITFPCGVPGQVWYLVISIPAQLRLASHHMYIHLFLSCSKFQTLFSHLSYLFFLFLEYNTCISKF